ARTGALDRDGQEPLLKPHATATGARAARLGHAPRRRSRRAAFGARNDPLVAHLFFAPERGLFEADLEVALDVALVALADAEDAQQIAQNSVEIELADVAHAAGEGAAGGEGRAGLLGPMTEPVVHRAAL